MTPPSTPQLVLCVPEYNIWCHLQRAYNLDEPYFIEGWVEWTDVFSPPPPQPDPLWEQISNLLFFGGLDELYDTAPAVSTACTTEELEMLECQVRSATCLVLAPPETTPKQFRAAIARLPEEDRPTKRHTDPIPWERRRGW